MPSSVRCEDLSAVGNFSSEVEDVSREPCLFPNDNISKTSEHEPPLQRTFSILPNMVVATSKATNPNIEKITVCNLLVISRYGQVKRPEKKNFWQRFVSKVLSTCTD